MGIGLLLTDFAAVSNLRLWIAFLTLASVPC